MLEISLDSPDLQREITRLPRLLADPTPILAEAGSQLARDLQDHFAERNQEPNKMGWPKKNFWAGIRLHTGVTSVTSSESVVSIADPAINQKVYGGTIRPKRGRMLAIPMNAAAYAAGRPSAIQGDFLRLVVTPDKKLFLVKREDSKTSSIADRYWYRLVPQVTQDPDPRALPDEDFLHGSVLYAIRGVIDAEIARGA